MLFFGKLGDLAGERERQAPFGEETNTLSALINLISDEDDVLGAALKAPSIRIAVNERIAEREDAIADGDEIAFLPPVSGG